MDKKYNILFAWPNECNPAKGGVERVTDIIAKQLIARGHSVYYLTDNREGKLSPGYNPPCEVLEIPWYEQDYHEGAEYAEVLREYNIHFVVDQTGPTCWQWLADRSLKVDGWPKYINVAHNDPIPHGVPYGQKTKHWIGLINSVLNYDCLAFISPEYRRKAAALRVNNPDCLLTTLKNPCSYIEDARDNDMRYKQNILLYVGRFDADKSPERLIDVWSGLCARHKNWKFVLVGGGRYEDRMKQLAAHYPNIEFVGWKKDPTPYYRRASISLLTSDREGCPMAVLEAMAFGCIPVVFDSFSSVKDIYPECCKHLLVPPYNIGKMVSTIHELIENVPMAYSTAIACREHVLSNYNTSDIVDSWEEMFRQLDK